MYWLILIAGLVMAGVAQPQPNQADPFQTLEPDYRKGYERLYPGNSDRQSTQVPTWTIPGVLDPESGITNNEPVYRFRGDPPASSVAPPGELRFRPLSPRERERLGPRRWRPLDGQSPPPDETSVPQSLFDTLVPGHFPAEDTWPR